MRQIHLPAVAGEQLWHGYRTLRPLGWWDWRLEGTPVHYPYALVSYYTRAKTPLVQHGKLYLFGDSGGYSVANVGAQIDPVDVIRWQIINCTVGPILDIPPFAGGGATLTAGVLKGTAADSWSSSLAKTVYNVGRALPIYLGAREAGAGFRWWGVVQGETRGQLEKWHEAIANVYPFKDDEGWAIPAKPTNSPIAIARTIGFARDKGIKRLHILGGMGLSGLTVAFILAREAGIELLTHDSSSSRARGLRRAVIIADEDGLGFSELTENNRDKNETKARDHMQVCPCWSCTSYRVDLQTRPACLIDNRYLSARMVCHNHIITTSVLERIWELTLTATEDIRKTMVRPRLWAQASRAFLGYEVQEVPDETSRPRSLLEYL